MWYLKFEISRNFQSRIQNHDSRFQIAQRIRAKIVCLECPFYMHLITGALGENRAVQILSDRMVDDCCRALPGLLKTPKMGVFTPYTSQITPLNRQQGVKIALSKFHLGVKIHLRKLFKA